MTLGTALLLLVVAGILLVLAGARIRKLTRELKVAKDDLQERVYRDWLR